MRVFILALLTSAIFGFASSPTVSQGAKTQRKITYTQSGQKLDLCKPSGVVRKTALVFIHGGGFRTGNRGQMLGYCRLLAKGGFTSITIDYRKTAQGHAYPKANQDTVASIAWLRAQSAALGIDPNKIVLIGYSAGATLALRVGLEDKNRIAGIVSVAGLSDFQQVMDETPHPQLNKDLTAYLGNTSPQIASPIGQVSQGDPPVFLFHGKQDNLVSVAQSVGLAKQLEANKVKVLLRVFENAGHEIMLPNKHLKQLLHEMTKFLVAIDQT